MEDTCRAFLEISLAENLIGKTINIGSGEEVSVNELFNKINKIMNSDSKIKYESDRLRPKNSEVERLLADVNLLMDTTKFKRRFSLEEGLACTVDWFTKKENLNQYKTDIYNL